MADSILKLKVESSEYDAKLKKAAEGIRHLADVAHKSGGDLTGLEKAELDYIKALGDMETKSRSAAGKTRELESAFKELTVVYNELNDVEKADEGGKALAASLETLKQRAQEAKGQLDQASQSLNNTQQEGNGTSTIMEQLAQRFTINIDAMKLFNVGLQAADAALDVAKDAFFASEATVDEWGRVMDSNKSLYEGFLTALNTGDISGYLSTINDIVTAARAAYDELDKLGSMKTIQAPQISAQQTENERLRMMIQTGRYIAPVDGRKASMAEGQQLTKTQIQTLERQLQNGMKTVVGLVGNEVKQTGKAIDAVYNRQAKELGMSVQEFRKGTSSWAEFSKKMAGYDAYKKWDAQARTQYARQGGQGSVDFDKSNPYADFKKWGTFRVDGERYNSLVQLIQQRDQQAAQAYGMQSQAYRTMNRAEGTTLRKIMGGGGSGSGKGGTTTTTPAQQAAKSIEAAEQEYARALEKAALEVQGGTISEAQQKQKQLAATEALWTAYGKASDTVDGKNEEYKKRQDELGQQIVSLGGETKSLQDAQKQAEEAYRQVAAQTQKMATAQEEANRAIASGDLKAFYAADKKLTAAGGKSASTGMDMSQVFGATQGNVDAFIASLKQQISQAELGTDLYNNLTAQLADTQALSNLLQVAIKNGIDPAQIGLVPEEFWKKIFGENPGDYINPETWKAIVDNLNEYIHKNGGSNKKVKLDVNTGNVTEKEDKTAQEQLTAMNTMINSLGSIASGVQNLGIEVPAGIMQGIAVLQTIMGIVSAIQTMQTVGTFLGIFHNGGIVHAANGWAGTVPGTSYSGDNIPIMVNSGELILNRAQQGNIASQLEGGGLGDLQLELRVDAEELIIMLNNNGKRRGLGRLING